MREGGEPTGRSSTSSSSSSSLVGFVFEDRAKGRRANNDSVGVSMAFLSDLKSGSDP